MKDVKCITLDFDGTLTNPERENATFETIYREHLALATSPRVNDA